MRVIVVDDERVILRGLVAEIENTEPTAEIYGFHDPGKALEFVKDTPCDVAFLDIQMEGMSGTELAEEMKGIIPSINIIFTTGYEEYRGDAFGMHASGYLMKPVTAEMIRTELDNLRFPVRISGKKRIRVQTFGNFEVFIDGKPVNFLYDKTKEMFAYLVDRKGAFCTNGEIMSAIWQDEIHCDYLRRIRKDLLDTMKTARCTDVFVQGRGKIAIITDRIDCDYYDYQKGEAYAQEIYNGEYMRQYGWAEYTNAALVMKKR
ncbi:MAG: response regulator [Lachnospiraceae bacterium]